MDTNRILFPSESLFFRYQQKYFCPLVDAAWCKEREKVLAESKSQGPAIIGGDARSVPLSSLCRFYLWVKQYCDVLWEVSWIDFLNCMHLPSISVLFTWWWNSAVISVYNTAYVLVLWFYISFHSGNRVTFHTKSPENPCIVLPRICYIFHFLWSWNVADVTVWVSVHSLAATQSWIWPQRKFWMFNQYRLVIF